MSKTALKTDGEFLVKDDKILTGVMTILFTGLFLYGLIDAILQGFTALNYVSYLFFISIIPAFLFFRKWRSEQIYIRINSKGIYQDEKLVTDWQHFLKAYVTQKHPSAMIINIQDNFIMVVEYWKNDPTAGFRRNIRLTNTQNKAEEEVMEAVRFYFTHWKQYTTP